MTDPRIAALAKAMTELFPAVQRDRWPFTSEQAAAAILAALPPDWCGHDEEIRDLTDSNQTWSEVSATVCAAAGVAALVHVPAEIARLRKERDRLIENADILRSEIARLRRIKEAARALMAPHTLTTANPPKGEPTAGWEWPEWDALRAALEDR